MNTNIIYSESDWYPRWYYILENKTSGKMYIGQKKHKEENGYRGNCIPVIINGIEYYSKAKAIKKLGLSKKKLNKILEEMNDSRIL